MSETHASGIGLPDDHDIELQHLRMQLQSAEAENAELILELDVARRRADELLEVVREAAKRCANLLRARATP